MGLLQQTHSCRFATVSPMGRGYPSIDARPMLSNSGGQCHVVSVRRKLNTKSALAKKLTFKMNSAYTLESEADLYRGQLKLP